MRSDVRADFEWGRTYLGHMRQIVGLHLVTEAPFEEDARHATDLIVLRLEAVRIACRVRRDHYRTSYGDQFTVRVDRPSGAESEMAKILAGWGDYMLYGFGAPNSTYLTQWALIDLYALRKWCTQHMARNDGQLPGEGRANRDGTTFRAFPLLPHLLHASHPAVAHAQAA